jgi:hypothetical protein
LKKYPNKNRAKDENKKSIYGRMFQGLLGIQRQGIAVERVAETICRVCWFQKKPRLATALARMPISAS